jgi:hypothetical protein
MTITPLGWALEIASRGREIFAILSIVFILSSFIGDSTWVNRWLLGVFGCVMIVWSMLTFPVPLGEGSIFVGRFSDLTMYALLGMAGALIVLRMVWGARGS